MHYRENFVHHSLEVPGLHGRGGIYFDDHFGAVSNCSGNVMYKAAGRSFLVNGGAGNNITVRHDAFRELFEATVL